MVAIEHTQCLVTRNTRTIFASWYHTLKANLKTIQTYQTTPDKAKKEDYKRYPQGLIMKQAIPALSGSDGGTNTHNTTP